MEKLRYWIADKLREWAYYVEPEYHSDIDLSEVIRGIEPLDTPFMNQEK